MTTNFLDISYACSKPLLGQQGVVLGRNSRTLLADICTYYENKYPEKAFTANNAEKPNVFDEYYEGRIKLNENTILQAYKDGYRQFVNVGAGFIISGPDQLKKMPDATFINLDLPEVVSFVKEVNHALRTKSSKITISEIDLNKPEQLEKYLTKAGVKKGEKTMYSAVGVASYIDYDNLMKSLTHISDRHEQSRVVLNFLPSKTDKNIFVLYDNGTGLCAHNVTKEHFLNSAKEAGFDMKGSLSSHAMLGEGKDQIKNFTYLLLESREKEIAPVTEQKRNRAFTEIAQPGIPGKGSTTGIFGK